MAEQPRKSQPVEDWNKDCFPTSAKPVFKAGLFLIALILSFCAYLYYSSENPEAQEARELRQERIRNNLLAEELISAETGFDLQD